VGLFKSRLLICTSILNLENGLSTYRKSNNYKNIVNYRKSYNTEHVRIIIMIA